MQWLVPLKAGVRQCRTSCWRSTSLKKDLCRLDILVRMVGSWWHGAEQLDICVSVSDLNRLLSIMNNPDHPQQWQQTQENIHNNMHLYCQTQNSRGVNILHGKLKSERKHACNMSLYVNKWSDITWRLMNHLSRQNNKFLWIIHGHIKDVRTSSLDVIRLLVVGSMINGQLPPVLLSSCTWILIQTTWSVLKLGVIKQWVLQLHLSSLQVHTHTM